MLSIDGIRGGGQLLRTALSLSAATGKPFTITNIRGQREERGLKPQHLTAVKALQKICNADVRGAKISSSELSFYPKTINSGVYTFDIGTAGSSALLLQTIIPVAIHAEETTRVIIFGGTDTKWCPPSMHMLHVLIPMLKKIGIDIAMTIEKFGFYPSGGGKIHAIIDPTSKLKELNCKERGALKNKEVIAYASVDLQAKKVAERMTAAFLKEMKDAEWGVHKKYIETLSAGCFLHASLDYENYSVGDDVLGEPRKSSEEVGKECASKIQHLINAGGLDEYAADQLMIYMALASKGFLRTAKITEHMLCNARVIELFLPVKFKIESNTITCGPVV